MWKKIKSIVDKYIYWQINKRTSSCYMRSAIIVTTTGEEKILFSNTATTECWYKIIPLSNLVFWQIVFCTFLYLFMFYAWVLIYGIKVVFKDYKSHKGKIFPPEMVWHWHGFLVHQFWMLSEISSTLCPTFLDCFFSTTFSFLFLIQCAVHYIFHYFDFLRDDQMCQSVTKSVWAILGANITILCKFLKFSFRFFIWIYL